MGHVVNRLPWCDIDIDTANGTVYFREKWAYTWALGKSVKAWTYAEKLAFHTRIDRVIWREWSGDRVAFAVSGMSDFAKRFKDTKVPINFDIQWVTSGGHWTVTVTKLPKSEFAQSYVIWSKRVISLDTNDFDKRLLDQIPVVHEFGHAIGYLQDEYKAVSPNKADSKSRMNHGNEMRDRYFGEILTALNSMIPNTTFTIKEAK